MTKLYEYTAVGRYYKVYNGGEYVSQHTTEREAIERANEIKLDNPDNDVFYLHDYEVTVGLTDAGVTIAQDYGVQEDLPPSIGSTPNPVFTGGTADSYDMSIHFTDDGVSTVTSSLINPLPNGLTYNGNTHILSYDGVAAASVSSHQLVVQDAVGSDTSGVFNLTINEAPTGPANDKAQVQSYDAAWRSEWVTRSKEILANATDQVEGMFIMIGDSLSRTRHIGSWAIARNGATAEDNEILDWMHVGTTPRVATREEVVNATQLADVIDGYYLQCPVNTQPPTAGYHLNNRSFTVGDGLGAWSYMDAGPMEAITDPVLARQVLVDGDLPESSQNDLSLTTILSGLQKPQFCLITIKSPGPGSDPTEMPNKYAEMCDQLEAAGVVPIIQTETYRRVYNDDPEAGNTTEQWMDAIDTQNAVRYAFAESRGYPIIDLQAEMEARWPVTVRSDDGLKDAWTNRVLSSDGVHLTQSNLGAKDGVGPYTSDGDPYADGGDTATHASGASLLYSGYALKGWCFAQKMKQIRQLVVNDDPQSLPLASINDFEYKGAFRMPVGTQSVPGHGDFKFDGNRSAFGPAEDRTKFFAHCQGSDSADGPEDFWWAQCNIPSGIDPAHTELSQLPEATVAQGPAHIAANCSRPIVGNNRLPNRTKYSFEYNGMLIGSVQHNYEGDNNATQFLWRADDSSDLVNANVDGYFAVTGYRNIPKECAVGWINPIPTEWQVLLNGQTHLAGAAGAFNRVEAYESDGPSLFLINLDQMTGPVPPTTVNYDLVWSFPESIDAGMWRNLYGNLIGVFGWDGAEGFPRDFRAAEGKDVRYNMYLRNDPDRRGDVVYPEQGDVVGNDLWTNHDRVGVGFIVPGTRTYACFGKAEGHQFGMGYDVIDEIGHETAGPQPYISTDRYNTAWFFDLNDAVDCLDGVKDSGDIVPYWWGEYEVPFERIPTGSGGEDTGYITGGWWDPDNKRLYLGVLSMDAVKPVICVFDYTG